MWRFGIILLVVIVADSAYSNPPSSAPRDAEQNNQARTKDNQQPTSPDQRGSENSPLFIKVIPPLAVEPGPTEHAQQTNGYTSPEWWLVWVTLILAVITAILTGYTAKLWGATKSLAEDAERTATRQASEMQTSLRIAQESADAAKNTALTMEETAERELRAYMMVNEVEIVNDPEPGYSGAYVYIHIKNFGQTPATDIRLAPSALIRERPLISPPLILDPSIKPMTLGILAPSDTLRSRFEIPRMEGTGDGFDIAKRTHAFYVFGMFQYRDAFHHERVT